MQQVWQFHLLLNRIIQEPPDRRFGDGTASLIPQTGIKFLSRYKQLLFQPPVDHLKVEQTEHQILTEGLAQQLVLSNMKGGQTARLKVKSRAELPPDFFVERLNNCASRVAVGVAKVLQSE